MKAQLRCSDQFPQETFSAESESVIIRIMVYSNYDIVKTFEFHVPLCCLQSGNKLLDSRGKVEKLNQSPKCGYYCCYWFIPLLLLQTLTIWFSIDLAQSSQKKMIKLSDSVATMILFITPIFDFR